MVGIVDVGAVGIDPEPRARGEGEGGADIAGEAVDLRHRQRRPVEIDVVAEQAAGRDLVLGDG